MYTLDSKTVQQWLQTGRMDVEGLLPWSSNYTFLVQIQPPPSADGKQPPEISAVYKPRQGERPLWDFPRATLCNREYATFLVSEAIGWDLVPPTVLRDGPQGIGSVQLFIAHDPENHYFTFEGNPDYRPQLQKIVLLDAMINNADRKGGHILVEERPDSAVGRLWGIDHGLGFHVEYKLRTVVWEFAGDGIPPQQLQALQELAEKVAVNREGIRSRLEALLTKAEVDMFQRRIAQLVDRGIFPTPGPGRPYPWPPV